MKKIINIIAITTICFVSCNPPTKDITANTADAIYYNGNIITMEGDGANYAEALAVKDGKIAFVGSRRMQKNGKATVL